MDNYLTLKDAEATINEWQARAERAQKACAEMREVLENLQKGIIVESTGDESCPSCLRSYCDSDEETDGEPIHFDDCKLKHALSTDCGSGYVRREELDLRTAELHAVIATAKRVEEELKAENAKLREKLEKLQKTPGGLTKSWAPKSELDAAKAEIARLREALRGLWNDCTASDFNEHWESYLNAEQALAGKEEK